MASYQEQTTPLQGVSILLNKVVQDQRGYFLDLAETDNPTIQSTKHIHAVIAHTKNKSRGEHYHYSLYEDFYTISGTSLCVLHDFNKESPSYQQSFAFVSGNALRDTKKQQIAKEHSIPSFFLEDNVVAQVRIPPLVWHAWWKLSHTPATIVATGTQGYDEDDYAKPKAIDIPQVLQLVSHYGITPE